MTLYLQKNYNGSFAIAELNTNKNDMFDADFFTLIDNIDKNTTYQDIINLVVEKFNCKKLVLDF